MTARPATVILAGHGSRSAEANAALRTRADALGRELGLTTVPAYLEFAEPSIPTTIAGCVAGGARRIIVLPYFLSPGMHVARDIVAIVETARAAHPGVELSIATFIGAHPAMTMLLADVAREALAGHGESKAV